MNGRTLARLAAVAACIGLGTATAVGTGTAAPAPSPATPTHSPATPAHSPMDTAIDHLDAAAGTNAAAKAAVTKLTETARLLTASKLDHIAGAFQPFFFSAPTFGCPGNPVSLTIASGEAGGNGVSNGLNGGYGTVRYQATPSAAGYPIGSGLNVAWLNTGNGRSGITPLNDLTQYKLPSLSKTVATGPGTVISAMWGTVNYPGGTCVMMPTVGAITVYSAPNPNFNAPLPDPKTPTEPQVQIPVP